MDSHQANEDKANLKRVSFNKEFCVLFQPHSPTQWQAQNRWESGFNQGFFFFLK